MRAEVLSALSDSQLMAGIQAGSVPALGGLYDRYCDRAYRVALSVCRDHGLAQDAVQNAFLSIWRSRGGYQEHRGGVAAWLLTSVRHRAIDIVRQNASYNANLAPEDLLDSVSAPGDTWERVAARDQTNRMYALLDRLPSDQQEAIALAFYGGLSHTQIAQHLGVPAGTVKGRIRLGLNKLRGEVERETA